MVIISGHNKRLIYLGLPRLFMCLYALDDEIIRLQTELPTLTGASRLRALLSLAWNLRQIDSQAALACADEAESLLVNGALLKNSGRDEHARLALVRAEVSALFHDFERAEQYLQEAKAHFATLHHRIGEGDAFLVEAIIAIEQGDMKRSVNAVNAAIRCFEEGDDPERHLLAQAWAIYLQSFSTPEIARDRLMQLLIKADEFRHPALAALIAAAQGEILFAHDSARSVVMFQQASELARQAGLIRLAIMSSCNSGVGLQKLRDFDAAAACYDWAVSCARKTGWPAMIAFSLIRLGELLRHLNHLEKSQQVLQEALLGLAGSKNGIHTAIAYAELANTLLLRDLPAEAATFFATAIDLYRSSGSRNNLAEHLISHARALSAAGDRFSALRAIQEAETLVVEFSSDSLQVELREALAEIHTHHDLPPPAGMSAPNATLHYLEDALCVGNALPGWQLPFKLLLSLAEAWAQAGDGQKAFSYAKQAIAADQRERSKQAENWATLMQVRHETERAKADAIHHQQLAAESQQTSQTLDLLGKIGQEITADLNFRNVCEILRRHLGALLNTTDMCIWLRDAEQMGLNLSYCVKKDVVIPNDALMPVQDTQNAALCIEQGQELLLETNAVDHDGRQMVLYGPLIVRDRALGVMAIQSSSFVGNCERQRLIFRSLCAYGAIALDNAHAHNAMQEAQQQLELALLEIKEASLTDPLTGLRNRRFLMQNIEADVALVVRNYQNAANTEKILNEADFLMFLVDLDHFKLVNDKFGHAAGDAILVQIKRRLQKVFRDSDYLIRWGGEEFLIVARGTCRDRAEELAERVRQIVSEDEFQLDGDLSIRQTCSVGFACFPFVKAQPKAITWQDVVDIADIALYSVKHAGRNGWAGFFAEEHAWPELLLCTLKADPKGAILNRELRLATNKTQDLIVEGLAGKLVITP